MFTFCLVWTENAFTTKKSTESDVYSYGVVLLELISGKKAVDPTFMEDVDIVGWVTSRWSNAEDIERIVDPIVLDEIISESSRGGGGGGGGIREQVREALLVALRCTKREPSKRPSMRQVVKELEDADVGTISYRQEGRTTSFNGPASSSDPLL